MCFEFKRVSQNEFQFETHFNSVLYYSVVYYTAVQHNMEARVRRRHPRSPPGLRGEREVVALAHMYIEISNIRLRI